MVRILSKATPLLLFVVVCHDFEFDLEFDLGFDRDILSYIERGKLSAETL